MQDVSMLTLTAMFFLTAWAYAGICHRLLSTDTAGEDADP